MSQKETSNPVDFQRTTLYYVLEDGTNLLVTCFMLGSFCDPEDGGDMFLKHVN
jgi:hypothetical protein